MHVEAAAELKFPIFFTLNNIAIEKCATYVHFNYVATKINYGLVIKTWLVSKCASFELLGNSFLF